MNEPHVGDIEKLLSGHGEKLSDQELSAIVTSAIIVLVHADAVDTFLDGADEITTLAVSGMFVGSLELAGRWGWLDDNIEEIRARLREKLKKGHSDD